MRPSFATGAAAIALAAALAQPAAAAVGRTAGGWLVTWSGGCTIEKVFADAGETELLLSIRPDGRLALWTVNAAWQTPASQRYDLRLTIGSVEHVAAEARGIGLASKGGYLATLEPDFLPAFAAGRELVLHVDGALAGRIPLAGSAAGTRLLRRCQDLAEANLDRLFAEFGRPNMVLAVPPSISPPPPPPVPPPPPPPPPALYPPPRLIAGTIGPKDYPKAALRFEEQGTVAVRLSINSRGAVRQCVVTASSGSAILDQRTCELMTKRYRFDPLPGKKLRRVVRTSSGRVSWRIPAD